MMNEIKSLIKDSSSIIIFLPNNLDFDNIGASLALKDFLEKKYKKSVEIWQVFQINQQPISNNTLIITLGIENIPAEIKDFPRIKINYQIGPQKYSSLSETIFYFLKLFSFEPNPEISSKLLIGIIFKTNLFRQPQITSKTIKGVVQLIKWGANYQNTINTLYRSLSFNQLQLWAKILTKVELWNKQTIAVFLTHNDFINSQTTEKDLEFIIPRINLNFHWAKNIFIFWPSPENPQEIDCWIKILPNLEKKIKQSNLQLNLTSGMKKNII
ncbi:MAG TPA: hypothetical protein ENL06_01745 [Candidatus Portnoybacteria bacterium]|nr:hypothetical protein [Candidatus Portnoybacteria bacterium]